MRILGLSGGSINGNSEILLKVALKAAQEVSPDDTHISFVRIPDVSIPKHYRTDDIRFSNGAIEQVDDDPLVPDDRPFVLDLIMQADVIILSCPIYTRTIPGIVKHFQDKTMGPFQDTAMARLRQKSQPGDDQEKYDLLFKPRVAGLIAVGGAAGTDWTPFGLPVMHQMLFPMGVKVVSQFQIHGCGLPASVLLDSAAISRAQGLGKAVVSQAGKHDALFLGDQKGVCPLCHLNMIVIKSGNLIECATCGASGKLVASQDATGQHSVVANFDADGQKTSVLTESGKDIHLQEIIRIGSALRPQLPSLESQREEFKGLDDVWLAELPSKTHCK
ncbi:flavoprotein-like protein [Talaromyces proteolyticus]|uniref:Flavoprotein-like protein n=1 Tax=Talaromyces proteolyticus TaxID=1131652 RepID=A0AAD4PTR7_9EURO|nr:flavoprotein-like protein [Talaromyces proteolyticus]KAH8691280.1 flavoprotein-like protein [Talaromyces proteolyticus]